MATLKVSLKSHLFVQFLAHYALISLTVLPAIMDSSSEQTTNATLLVWRDTTPTATPMFVQSVPTIATPATATMGVSPVAPRLISEY